MWNQLVYFRGGLAMHSGAKTFPAEATPDGQERLALIIGLSGTGKTTTTFRNVLGSLPVQDDFVALMPDGTVHATENGCFAKTIGLDPDNEPTIHSGASSAQAWLESTHVEPDGTVDFFDGSYTTNGRCTFGLDMIRHREPRALPEAHYLFILNRNADVTPAVAKLEPQQAAERVPGTNPFWFEEDSSQGNRMLELLEQVDLEVYLFNTGSVGGDEKAATSKKVNIHHSAAVQEGIVNGSITWQVDPDFGYLVATSIPGFDDDELLQPRRLYERQGRGDEYERIVAQLLAERREYLAAFTNLDEQIVGPTRNGTSS